MKAKAIAPTNIAIVKYWGKNPLWEKYHIPCKSSVSFTVSDLYTETVLEVERGSGSVEFELNGKKISKDEKEFEYVGKYIAKLNELVPETKNYDYYIKTKNNFPTAAGFASSASGFGAMARALQGVMKELEPKAYEKYFSDDSKLSVFARLGSGSATRSIPEKGGLVIWHRGIPMDYPFGPDEVSNETKEKVIFSSYAESLFPHDYWPELRIIYVSVKKSEKKVKSRAGMKMTLKTNPIYRYWVEYEESTLLKEVINAVRKKDFGKLVELTIKLSNGLHAMMLYTMPRIVYMNDTSHQVIERILELNESEPKASYTFDAGPNAVVFTLDKYEEEVVSVLSEVVGKQNIVVTKPGKGSRLVE